MRFSVRGGYCSGRIDNLGHYGTGNLQVTIKSIKDFGKAKLLIDRA